MKGKIIKSKEELRHFIAQKAVPSGRLNKASLGPLLQYSKGKKLVNFNGKSLDLLILKFGDSMQVTIEQYMDIWSYLEVQLEIFNKYAERGVIKRSIFHDLLCDTFETNFDNVFVKNIITYYGQLTFDNFVHCKHFLAVLSHRIDMKSCRNPWFEFSHLVTTGPTAPVVSTFKEEPPPYEEAIRHDEMI